MQKNHSDYDALDGALGKSITAVVTQDGGNKMPDNRTICYQVMR